MDKAIDVFSKELSSLRTGRANAAMLDLVKVDVYGQQMPINQIASITTPEPRMINIQVWDQNNVNLLDAAIKKSELGLNPQIDGQETIIDGASDVIDKAMTENQIQGGANDVSENMETLDDDASDSSNDETSSDDII